jgi:anaerobic magnesium-protoporphyrin IX monomethyl ester cyclase
LDAAALGEGEIIFKNLVGRLRNQMSWKDVPGLAYREEGHLVVNPPQAKIKDLDHYEIDYGKIDLERYFRLYEKGFPARVSYEYPGSHRAVSMVTSRGCPFKCVFCSIHLHMGYAFRWHSAENVVAHIKHLVERYDVRHFHFEDDNLTLYKPRFKKILEGIIENRLRITWDTPNGVRADMLDRELISLAKESGCVYLMFGVESGNQRVLDTIVKKDLNLGDVVNSARICHEVGLDTAAFYIFGFPGETKQDIEDTYNLAFEMFRKYKTRPHVNIARPLRGTELYRMAKEKNVLIDTEMLDPEDRYKVPKILIGPEMIQTEEFTLEDLTKVFERYQREFLRQSILNWMEAAVRLPWTFARSIGPMLLEVLRRPIRARTTLYRYYIRKFIFPHAMGREAILRSSRERDAERSSQRQAPQEAMATTTI